MIPFLAWYAKTSPVLLRRKAVLVGLLVPSSAIFFGYLFGGQKATRNRKVPV